VEKSEGVERLIDRVMLEGLWSPTTPVEGDEATTTPTPSVAVRSGGWRLEEWDEGTPHPDDGYDWGSAQAAVEKMIG
jgi:hypothetical protein